MMIAWTREHPGKIGCASEVESIRCTDASDLREREDIS